MEDERRIISLVEYHMHDEDSESSDRDDGISSEGEIMAKGDKKSKNPNVSYDTSLPAQHTYLGNDLEELSGRTLLDDDSCQSLPLLPLPGIVLIPGQTLPLQLFEPSAVSMVKRIIEKDRTLGIVNQHQSPSADVACIGTTAEIRSYIERADEDIRLSTIRLKAEGRQRFQVIETRRQIDGVLMGKVRILPEITLDDPGEGARLHCLDRFRTLPLSTPEHMKVKEQGSIADSTLFKSLVRGKYDKFDFANYTRWPRWVYQQYDTHLLVQRIKQELEKWNCSVPADKVAKTPVDFSYWVAANLPLDDYKRLFLLGLNSDIQRLRCELSMLERYTVLCCRISSCNKDIINRCDVFSMSLEGLQGTYVNPSGYVHEIVTSYKACGLLLQNRSSTEQSWFPGYAWTIASCSGCGSHMGWKFTATKRKLQPQQFWGLCRAALRPALCSGREDEQWKPSF
ncbi:protein cereblon-like isoform X2 [Limulus polyphemus]|uniref:Protein cereblon n=1 Tax=Limulus polyphemus TaxID=6850 RepID=A0ABM1BXU8_LIMPO|nr:protein cereblon-like isoform X2 [Limulus polyphemus]